MTDNDLDRWTVAWRANAPQSTDLAHMARREHRVLLAWITLDWCVGLALFGFAAWLWVADGSPVMRFAAIGIVVLTAVVLAFTVVNWRGSLGGEQASAAEFLALAEQRSVARLRYIRFGWWILAADLVVIAGAHVLEFADGGLKRLPSMLAMALAATAVAAGILLWWGRRERRRAQRLAELRAGLAADPEAGRG